MTDVGVNEQKILGDQPIAESVLDFDWVPSPGVPMVSLDKVTVVSALYAAEVELREIGVESLYLFGSVARDEATDDIDVDIAVEPDKKRPRSSLVILDAGGEVSKMLNRKVDCVRYPLNPRLAEAVGDELVVVF